MSDIQSLVGTIASFSDDYDLDDRPCPKCNHHFTHSRICDSLYCEDGYIDESEEDPINLCPGEEYTKCAECGGTGIQWWCPSCGESLNE